MAFESAYPDGVHNICFLLLQYKVPQKTIVELMAAHSIDINPGTLKTRWSKKSKEAPLINIEEIQEYLDEFGISMDEIQAIIGDNTNERKVQPTATPPKATPKVPPVVPQVEEDEEEEEEDVMDDVGETPDMKTIKIEPETKEETSVPEKIKRMTPSDVVRWYGRDGVEELKRRKLEEELGRAPIKTQVIDDILYRWDNNPRIRDDPQSLLSLLKNYLPTSINQYRVLEICSYVEDIEREYAHLLQDNSVYLSPQPHTQVNPQPQLQAQPRTAPAVQPQYQQPQYQTNVQPPQLQRQTQVQPQYQAPQYTPVQAQPQAALVQPGVAPGVAPVNGGTTAAPQGSADPVLLTILTRLENMEKKINEQNTNANESKEKEDSIWYQRYKDLEMQSSNHLSSVTGGMDELKRQINKMEDEKNTRDLLDGVNRSINDRMGPVGAELDNIKRNLSKLNLGTPQDATYSETLQRQEISDTHTLKMRELDDKRDKEEREDARRTATSTRFAEFIEGLGTKVGKAAAATVTDGSGKEHSDVPVMSVADQENLLLFPCPECNSPVYFPKTAAQIKCPTCPAIFNNPTIQPQSQQEVETTVESTVETEVVKPEVETVTKPEVIDESV